jgi:hemerythrin
MRQTTSRLNPDLDEDIDGELRDLGRDHMQVFALIGKFINRVRSGSETSWALVLLERIIMLILIHCQAEENLLRRIGHPSLAEQNAAHRRILAELEHFREGLLTGRDLPLNEYFHVFDSLIVHHLRDDPGCEDVGELADWLAAGP